MHVTGEFARLARLDPHLATSGAGVPVGVGDDAAVVTIGGSEVVVCVDTLVEGVHFRRDWSAPADVGWKAVAVNVSDVAAMGAVPRAAVIALNRPAALAEADVDELYRGMAEAAQAWGVALVGGDTTTGEEWTISVTVLGDLVSADGVVGPVLRSGARVGDVVVLAGPIGAAAAAVEALGSGEGVDPAHLHAHRRPRALPRTGRALAQAGATAMIDISDGLGADARHICEASGVWMRLDATAVRSMVADRVAEAVGAGGLDLAIGGGEDFALLATLPPDLVEGALAAVAEAGETRAAVIGTVTAVATDATSRRPPSVWLDGEDDPQRRIDGVGYDHG